MSDITATHVHVENQARDCDGLYDRSHVLDGPMAENTSLLDLPFTYHGAGSFHHTVDDDGLYTVEFSVGTDEGFTSTTYRECADDCDDQSTFRDHTAEAAGY